MLFRSLRGSEDTVALRASCIHLDAAAANAADNTAPGQIQRRLFHGDFIEYVVTWAGGHLMVRRPPTEIFAEGSAVTLSFDARHCVLLEADG